MITGMHYENYKSFKKLDFLLKKNQKDAKNIVAIYGENGSGKSNIIDSFAILSLSVGTLSFFYKTMEMRKVFEEKKDGQQYLSNEESKDFGNFFFCFRNMDLSKVIKNARMIGSDGDMVLEYSFVMDGSSGQYTLKFDSDNFLIEESLSYKLKEREGKLFSIVRADDDICVKALSDRIFYGKQIRTSMELEIEKFWGKHTFLAILNSLTKTYNEDYIKKNISPNIFKVINEFYGISLKTSEFWALTKEKSILGTESLASGEIDAEDEAKLKKTEELLCKYYSSLHTDVKGVFYSVKKAKDEEGRLKYRLYFNKVIGGEIRKIPFRLESKGTKQLLHLFPIFVSLNDPEAIVVIDEADSSIHDILFSSLLETIKDGIKGQFIFTTHNTSLLESLSPKSAYLLSVDAEGDKRITSLNDYGGIKISAHNNMRKMYREGALGAIPYPMELTLQDFSEAKANL